MSDDTITVAVRYTKQIMCKALVEVDRLDYDAWRRDSGDLPDTDEVLQAYIESDEIADQVGSEDDSNVYYPRTLDAVTRQ